MLKKILFALAGLSAAQATAQQVRPAQSDKIYHEIAQLRHLANVLYVAAHPDDENTRLLAWLVNDRHIRTAYLSLTRGDGGQNILGSEQGDALGLIRTHELMEARKIDGAEQFFARAVDFGFSKTYDETFKHWDKDVLVGDAVWVMRKFRPDVVICRFPPNKEAGHGHHAASAIIGAEAFKAAGDNSRYPAQLQYYKAWKPTRIFWNTYKFGDRNTTSEDQFKLTVGDYIPTMGMGTGELAGISRSIHRSQGAGTPSVPGVQTEYFKLVDGEPAKTSLFDGIDITWGRVGRKDIGDELKQVLNDFDFRHPEYSIPALMAVRKKITTVTDEYWRNEKLQEINKVILDCTGLMAELYTKRAETVAGETMNFTMKVIARSNMPVVLQSVSWGNGTDSAIGRNISNDSLLSFDHTMAVPASAVYSEPYWLSATSKDKGQFNIPSVDVLGLPETPVALHASLSVMVAGEQFTIEVPWSYKKLDPVKGDVVEALRIEPKVSVSFMSHVLIARPDGGAEADIRLHAYKTLSNASLRITYLSPFPLGGAGMVRVDSISLAANIDTVIHMSMSSNLLGRDKVAVAEVTASVLEDGKEYDRELHLIQYGHLPVLQYFTTSKAKVLQPKWKCTAKRIGYIEGAGDMVPQVLRQAGIAVDVLKDADLADAANLKKYDAIVTGIRAVNVEKRMSIWLPVLMKYAENGGTLVMQYNTTQDMATTKMGPYPFTIASDKRVTEEDATITFIDPSARLLNYPNKIDQNDFNGWVQERGLYFPVKWDEKYTPLFSMHDAGEDPLTGGTLYAKLGKGHYVYTPLSFSRQLPAGNTGAIRLFMNMLSVGK